MKRYFVSLLLSLAFLTGQGQLLSRIGVIAASHAATVTVTYDPDAEAFFTARGGMTDGEKTAVNKLVTDLKTNSFWTSIVAFYPASGTTAAQQGLNLKDPRNLDAAFRLTWFGTWVHDASGALPDGNTAYANTHLAPTSWLSLSATTIQYYSKTNALTAAYDMGTKGSAGNNSRLALIIKFSNNISYATVHSNDNSVGAVVGETRGLFTATRTGLNALAFYKGGTQLATSATASGDLSDFPIFIGANNTVGTPDSYTTKKWAGGAIFNVGFTAAQVATLNIIWNDYQTALGRNEL